MFIVLSGEGTYASLIEAGDTGVAVFAYGAFITAVINFLIIAFVVFMLVRYVNKVREAAAREEEAAPAPEEPKGPTELEVLLEIRVSLKK